MLLWTPQFTGFLFQKPEAPLGCEQKEFGKLTPLSCSSVPPKVCMDLLCLVPCKIKTEAARYSMELLLEHTTPQHHCN